MLAHYQIWDYVYSRHTGVIYRIIPSNVTDVKCIKHFSTGIETKVTEQKLIDDYCNLGYSLIRVRLLDPKNGWAWKFSGFDYDGNVQKFKYTLTSGSKYCKILAERIVKFMVFWV